MKILTLIASLHWFPNVVLSKRIAVIGGGISGTFATKYLVDYDDSCLFDEIVLFDPLPIGAPTTSTDDRDWQGSRVAAVQLDDGSVVEIGASVFIQGFQLVLDMIKQDGSLVVGEAFNTGKSDKLNPRLRQGVGIYDGNGEWKLLTTKGPSFLSGLRVFWRYNVDLLRAFAAATRTEDSFVELHKLLESTHRSTFYENPNEMWEQVGLLLPARLTFDDFLDRINVSRNMPWWRKLLPFQGSLRSELLAAVNQCNYNQGMKQVNALVGLGSLVSAKVDLRSIVGGNQQVIQSAFQQAKKNSEQRCKSSTRAEVVKHVSKRVTSVVGKLDYMEVFAGSESLGKFDIVIHAAPLQQSRIEFLVQSSKDDAVLQEMPFRLIEMDNDDFDNTAEPQDQPQMPHPPPATATLPYTQVVTTLVSNASLNATHLSVPESLLPRGVYTTEAGKARFHNITAIAQLTPEGAYKIFSSDVLSDGLLSTLFGPQHRVDFVKVWGGPHGGATPDYEGTDFHVMDYLLYDSGKGIKGHTDGAALYYPNAIEASMACMELSAIGAKSVAKLIARRLGLVHPWEQDGAEDEL